MFDYRGYFMRLLVLAILGVSLFGFISDSSNPSPSTTSSGTISDQDESLRFLWEATGNIDFRVATITVSLILVISVISTLYIHYSEGDDEYE